MGALEASAWESHIFSQHEASGPSCSCRSGIAEPEPKADADPYLLYGHGLYGGYGLGYYGHGLYGGYGGYGYGLWGRKKREAEAEPAAEPSAKASAEPGYYYGHGYGLGYGLGYGHYGLGHRG